MEGMLKISFIFLDCNFLDMKVMSLLFTYFLFPSICSAHTDCIVAEDQKTAETFLCQVDR